MPDFRAHVPPQPAGTEEIRLSAAESHHLIVVNRCRPGDLVVAFDGCGNEWECECIDPAKNAAVLSVRRTRHAAPRPHQITLAQALPKGATMDEIVRQATELGIARIVPVLAERTQVHLEGDRAERKVEKWRTTAIEAAKQCGNPWLPEIAAVQELDELLRITSSSPAAPVTSAANTAAATIAPTATGGDHAEPCDRRGERSPMHFDLKLVASLHVGARPLRQVLDHYRTNHPQPPRTALWLVGPEGDFSATEMAAIVRAGCVPVTLGPLVLRCDTAAVAALSVLSYELTAT